MTIRWRELPDGRRTFPWSSSARWRYGPHGNITATTAAGVPIEISSEKYRKTAEHVAARLREGIEAAGADAWYLRALITIAMHECSTATLPCWGDCRMPDGKIVRCGTPGAKPPLSVGYYQLLRATAANMGTSFNELARSPAANHRAALRLARSQEPRHGRDFVTLAAVWNAGDVYQVKTPPWGARMYRPETLTQYAGAWNAAGAVLSRAEPKAGLSDSLETLAVVLAVKWAVSRIGDAA